MPSCSKACSKGQSTIEPRCGAMCILQKQNASDIFVSTKMPTAGRLRGQSATETMVVLAVVLVIALVGVSLLGESIGKVGGIKESESKAYWLAQTPLSILDWSAGSGNLTLRIKNNDIYPMQITGVVGNGQEATVSGSGWIEAGSEKTISLQYGGLNPSSPCSSDGKTSGMLVLDNFGVRFDQKVSSGGVGTTISKVQQSGNSMPLAISCFAPNSSGGVACGSGTCTVGQSCCAAKTPNYCYATSGGICDACGGSCGAQTCCGDGLCRDSCVACGGGYCDSGQTCCPDNICRASCGVACGAEICEEGTTCCSAVEPFYCSKLPERPCDVCGGVCQKVGASCCGEGDVPYCYRLPDKICDACGGCEAGQFCCNSESTQPFCTPIGNSCDDACGNSCKYETEKCCDAGETPNCIPKEWSCDACGGCEPKTGACCPRIAQCRMNGADCEDGTIACYGSLCDKKTQECCAFEGLEGCVDRGMCKK
ncbi:MAG: hypothetical protein WC588_02200 [Candidatus Micrarchaeia archaeon]